MRLWSLHPEYLDSRGLVALWREGLLAQKVLKGKTRGFRHHPQLIRFRTTPDPLTAIAAYLHVVLEEALQRGYSFDGSKIERRKEPLTLPITDGQLRYELAHLRSKLRNRDRAAYRRIQRLRLPRPHPLFTVVSGDIEDWERL